MPKSFVLAWGIDIASPTKEHIAHARAIIQRIKADPRVNAVYGATGQSAGIVLDVETEHAQRVANLLKVAGMPKVQVIQVVPEQEFMDGLQEAERLCGFVSEAFRNGEAVTIGP